MPKSVYSMLLNDEVIEKIDDIALKNGLSRSQVVNNCLAEYLGLKLSRSVIDEIIASLTTAICDHNRMRIARRQTYAVDYYSAVNYKYSPRVTYSVDFSSDGAFGDLKLSLRSTSEELAQIFSAFFNDFIAVEKSVNPNVLFYIENGKLIRRLDFSQISSTEELSLSITEYVKILDMLLNKYVYEFPSGLQTESLIKNYLAVKDQIKV